MAGERITIAGPEIFQPSEVTNNDIVTTPGQFFYPLPSGTQKVNAIRVLYNSVWIPVTLADRYTDILYSDPLQPPFTSLPVTLAKVYGQNLRLFPTPDGQYPVELTMERTPPAPTNDQDDTNFWVTDGRVYLINATMLEICKEYLDLANPNSPRIAKLETSTEQARLALLSTALNVDGPFIMRVNN